jgi:lipoate-protein ligase A
MDVRLIIDEPARGAWNMALDEALLEWAAQTGGSALRFYQWSRPTLSLGYFQACCSRAHHAGSCGLPLVRRASGGGAIVHDHELTYSFVTPVRSRFAGQAHSWIGLFHQALVDCLADWSLQAGLCRSPPPVSREREPFLCFQRRAVNDVLSSDHKIAGSAQRRRKAAVLQHGSVLLARSRHATELQGVRELAGRPLSAEQLIAAWADQLRRPGLDFAASRTTSHELARARWWRANRFAAARWTHKR